MMVDFKYVRGTKLHAVHSTQISGIYAVFDLLCCLLLAQQYSKLLLADD